MFFRNLILSRCLYAHKIIKQANLLKPTKLIVRGLCSKFDPPYLKLLVPEIPEYPLLNIQVKSYDFPPLEHYAKYVVKTATHMGLDVVDSWPTPGTDYHIKSYAPGTTAIEHEYKLTLYERNVQISNVPSTVLPLFIQLIQNCIPEGIQLSVHPHEQHHENNRYIPDLELEELNRELEEMKKPQK